MDPRLNPTYEALLTTLCQRGLASAWGPSLAVADPDAARSAVVTRAQDFGDELVKSLAARLDQCPHHAEHETQLVPLVCRGRKLEGVLHITAASTKLCDQLDGKAVFVWDAGHGTRMEGALKSGQTKGEAQVMDGLRLFECAAGAAQWLVSALRDMNRDYIALVAADQVLCLSESDERELVTLLEAASSPEADVIFFDGPPALSLLRLRFLLDSSRPPRPDSAMALARDRQMLRNYGGGHVLQCVLLKKNHVPALADALDTVLEAARQGCDVDLGVVDIAVLPRLIGYSWLKKQRPPAFRAIHAAIGRLCLRMRRVRSVSMALQVFNVNTPGVLGHLGERIRCDTVDGVQP